MADPTWDESTPVADQTETVPTWEESSELEDSPVAAFASGAAEAATFGLAPEIEAGAKTAWRALTNAKEYDTEGKVPAKSPTYEQELETVENRYKGLEESNPRAYDAGEIAPLAIPGALIAKASVKGLKKLPGKIKQKMAKKDTKKAEEVFKTDMEEVRKTGKPGPLGDVPSEWAKKGGEMTTDLAKKQKTTEAVVDTAVKAASYIAPGGAFRAGRDLLSEAKKGALSKIAGKGKKITAKNNDVAFKPVTRTPPE